MFSRNKIFFGGKPRKGVLPGAHHSSTLNHKPQTLDSLDRLGGVEALENVLDRLHLVGLELGVPNAEHQDVPLDLYFVGFRV